MAFTRMDFLEPAEGLAGVSRYLTWRKFESLIRLRAMWFSTLAALQDRFEGTLPKTAFDRLNQVHRAMAKNFPGQEWQFADMAARRTKDIRTMTCVNCWYLGREESECMWSAYAPEADSVMIVSSIDQLDAAFGVGDKGSSLLGRAKYVKFETFDLATYDASNAAKVIFLKQEKYREENELRLSVLNVVVPGRRNEDERPCSPTQIRGPGQFNPNRRGLFVPCDLRILVSSVVLSPRSDSTLRDAVKTILSRYGLAFLPIQASTLKRH